MLLRRFHDPKLAQTSYLVGCHASREALVVDPNRDIDRYLRTAEEEGFRIAHVTETHIHADFVSGSRELAYRTGARLYLSDAGGPDWSYQYAADASATLLRDDSCFRVGAVELRAVHVPGHTPEHLAFLVTDTETAAEPMGAFTGDFLFVGDVGRPDLLERAVRVPGTMESEARRLFRSLQQFRALPDFLQIWPGHGAGSACGKSLSAVPHSTLGYETRFNWAFSIADENEFVRVVLEGQPEPPRYFARMKRINRSGPALLDAGRQLASLPASTLASVLARGDSVVDTRRATDFAQGAVPGTINIPANRTFTTWAGSLLGCDRDVYLIVDRGRAERVEELGRDLAGIGFDHLAGYFTGDVVDAWRGSMGQLQTTAELTLAEVAERLGSAGAGRELALDVRGAGEWEAGHIPGALHIPLGELDQRLEEIPRNRVVIAHCQTGARAAMAASILRARGFNDVRQFPGGFAEWRAAGLPVESGSG
jgi:hydroxyacylglutathione hydrolase